MDGDGVLLSNWFYDDVPLAGVEFADGSGWDAEELAAMAQASSLIVGSSGSDELGGTDFGDTMHGLAGTDWLSGGDGGDRLYGGDGTDRLFGGAGDDTLIGGAGNDRLRGDVGDDTYVFNRGDGDDQIFNYRDEEEGATIGLDVILLGGDIAPDKVRIFAFDDEGELVVGLSLADEEDGSVGIYGDLADLPAVRFADGTVRDGDTLRAMIVNTEGTELDDLLVGTGGGDVLRGGAGYDTTLRS
ncbi:MAG: hypothetical protein IPK39_23210 [Sulfuritalea sp.]|nr:hypothetical protein [Sulfuritalea sp.]